MVELAIIDKAREIIETHKGDIEKTYFALVEFYKKQVLLSFRNSTSILLQQYSTPVPIAFLMGIYCQIQTFKGEKIAFEPSAGNGVLLIACKPENADVNEIDKLRRKNLFRRDFNNVTGYDASKSEIYGGVTDNRVKKYDAVLSNPPFSKIDPIEIKGYTIKDLDHLMAIRALDCMKDDGRAAIIFGGHTRYDQWGRISSPKDRYFLNYLYANYNIDDLINVDGDIYSKMGVSASIRIVLINGRKLTPQGFAPPKQYTNSDVEYDFESLFNRFYPFLNESDSLFERMAKSDFLFLKNYYKSSR